MGLFFACPNCSEPVDPMLANAVMHPTTKQWQHIDCSLPHPPRRHRTKEAPPKKDRRRRPRRRH